MSEEPEEAATSEEPTPADEPTAADEPASAEEAAPAEEPIGSPVEPTASTGESSEPPVKGSEEEAPLSPLMLVVLVALLGVVIYALVPKGNGAEGPASADEIGEMVQRGSQVATQRGPEGGLEKALPYFAQAVKLGPDDVRANATLGRCLTELNRFQEALPYLQKAVEKKPSLHAGHLYMGMALTGLERHKEARAALKLAVETDPKDSRPLYFLGIGAMRLGEDEATVRFLEPYVRDVPRNPVAWRIYADALTKLGREEDAIAALTSLARLTPGDVQIRQDLQDRRIRREGFEAVLADHRAQTKAEGAGAETLYLYARLLSLSPDRASETRAAFEVFLERFPQALRAQVDLAREDVRDGKLEDARRRLDRVVSSEPRMIDARAVLADVEVQAGNYEGARKIYEALLGGPLEAHARLGIASSFLDEGQGEEALRFVQGLLEGAAPGDPRRWALEGEVLQNLGRFDEARAVLDGLLEKGREQDALIWQGYVAFLELERGDLDAAKEAFAKLAELGAKKDLPPDVHLWTGVAAAERGDRAAAEASWKKGATGPDHGEPSLHTRACRRLLGEVERDQLLAAVRMAGYRYQGDALFCEGLALELAGEKEAARAAYRESRAAERQDEFPARLAQRALERVK